MSWKLAVSTLGMPGTAVREAVRVAAEAGCHGVELRVHPDEEIHLDASAQRIRRARAMVEDAGLETACLAGYTKVCGPGDDGPVIAELRSLIELAHGLGAPSVRVFPGGENGRDGPALDRIGAVLPDLAAHRVRLLVETHDSHPTGESALRLAEPFATPGSVSVLWDALHPWRMGEPPAHTRDVLGAYLGYFQVKDATAANGWTPTPPGQGDVPLADCARSLQAWSGWVSLEWERAWYPAIDPIQVPLRAAAAWFDRWHPST